MVIASTIILIVFFISLTLVYRAALTYNIPIKDRASLVGNRFIMATKSNKEFFDKEEHIDDFYVQRKVEEAENVSCFKVDVLVFYKEKEEAIWKRRFYVGQK